MKITRIIAAALLALPLCACRPERQDKATVEFWTIQLKPVFTSYIEGMIAEYEKGHPGVHVQWVDVPFNGVREKLMTAYLAGKAPDVVNLNVDMTMSMATLGALVDMESALPPEVKADYLESAWGSARIGKSVYALPWYLATNVTIYNRELIEKAGLPQGRPPATFAELETAAAAVKEKTGKFLLSPKIGTDTDILKYFVMDGAEVFDGRKVNITGTASAANMEMWKRLFKGGCIPRASAIEDHRVALNMFIKEETAIFFSGPQFLKIVRENNPALYGKVDVTLPLYGKAGVVDIDVMNIAVTSASKHRKEAVDFAAFVTNGPNQLAFSRLVAILPSVKSALSDPFFADPGEKDIEQKARHIAAQSLIKSRVLLPGLTNLTQIQTIMQNAEQQIFMDKTQTAAALADAQKRINELIAK